MYGAWPGALSFFSYQSIPFMRWSSLILWMGWLCLFASCKEPNRNPSLGEASTQFTSLDPAGAGIDFRNDLIYSDSFNIYLFKSFYNGAGVGIADFNRDGLQDLFLCGNQTDNRLYLNRGDFRFTDATAAAGVASSGAWSTGVSIADINADGWPDIYVCKSGHPEGENRRNELFLHTGRLDADGRPTFREAAADYGIDDLGFSVHATFFDYDRDGDLDMYLLNNSIQPSEIIQEARRGLRNRYDEAGGNKLYRNDGDVFTDVTRQAGIYSSAIGFGLGVSVGDVNRDGWPDIYVANDFFEKDYLYLNDQSGGFTESLEQTIDEISLGAMGVDIADANNDGYPDIFVTEMLPEGNRRQKTKATYDNWNTYALKVKNGYYRQFPRNTFQLNRGPQPGRAPVAFSEISRLSGTAATEWSWGVQMLDLDNDGFKEIFITNGIVKDLLDQDYIDFYNDPSRMRQIYEEKGAVIKELIDNIPSQPVANHLYRKEEGMRYRNVSENWGLGEPAFSTGAAFGDLDNDGDLDLIVNNLNRAPFLYRNESNSRNVHHYLTIELQGGDRNLQAFGAQVSIKAGGRLFFQEQFPMRGSMSAISPLLHFGLGEAEGVDSLIVRWPDGSVTRRHDLAADQRLVLRQKAANKARPATAPSKSAKVLLRNISGQFPDNYRHRENEFSDFDRHPLLYHSLSMEGPGIATGDINRDGYSDCFIGGAAGSAGALYYGAPEGLARRPAHPVLEKDHSSEDTDAVLVDVNGDGYRDLLVASGGYAFPPSSFSLANRLYLNDGKGGWARSKELMPNGALASTSCIRHADYDGDGDQDLFIGTRAVALQYGVPADSYLLQNDGKGHFTDVSARLAPSLKKIGMVTDAVWLDYDRDGDPDLAVAGEWMPVRLLENQDGQLIPVADKAGLQNTRGFWNTIEAADLDDDGYPELVAGNLGQNTFFRASTDQPVRMHVNDFDRNGDIDHLLSVYEAGKSYPTPTKKEITKQMPYLLKKYLKHADYSDQSVENIFTEAQLESSILLKTEHTASTVFWNNAGAFKAQPLPEEAQLSPVYAILIEDIDGDGVKDLLLGGNLHMAKPQTGIYAASRGLMLRGIGRRGWQVVPAIRSGFALDGQIRDIAQLNAPGQNRLILVARSDDEMAILKRTKSDILK